MSLITISDLHRHNTNLLVTLIDSAKIIGGKEAESPAVAASAPPNSVNPFAPYSGAYSITTSNSTRSDFLATSVGANFNAAFTVNSPNPSQTVSGGLSVSVDYMGQPLIRTN
jgi:hypothetical protein